MQNNSNNFLLGKSAHDIYFANPLGFTESGRVFVEEYILPKITSQGASVYEPFREFVSRAISKFGAFDLSKRETTQFGADSNANAIKDSKVILAVLDGVDIDSGTASEIGYATALGKRVIGIRTDFRCNSSDGQSVKVNLQVEGFIAMSGGSVYNTYEEAISETIKYISTL